MSDLPLIEAASLDDALTTADPTLPTIHTDGIVVFGPHGAATVVSAQRWLLPGDSLLLRDSSYRVETVTRAAGRFVCSMREGAQR